MTGRTRILNAGALRRSMQCSLAALALTVVKVSSCKADVANAEPPAGQIASQSARSTPALPDVTVEAQRATLEHRVQIFVRAITQSPEFHDESLVRWNTPICFLVTGFAAEQAKLVVARLSEIAASAGAAVGREGCQPNFIVIWTPEPDRVLAAWSARDSRIFGNAPAAQVRRFLDSSKTRPVRVWHSIDRGRVAGMRNGHFVPSNLRAEGSPFVWNGVLGFHSVFAIIDANRAGLAKEDQLADYVAMAGLTNTDLAADIGTAPSILRLFDTPGETPPSGLSSWDLAFLKALYRSDQNSRAQLVDIANRVARDVLTVDRPEPVQEH
jgi:hypothetical protein